MFVLGNKDRDRGLATDFTMSKSTGICRYPPGFRTTKVLSTGFSTKLQRTSLISVWWTRLRDCWNTRISWTGLLCTTRDWQQVQYFPISSLLILDILVGAKIAAKHNKLNSEDTFGFQTSIKSRIYFSFFKNIYSVTRNNTAGSHRLGCDPDNGYCQKSRVCSSQNVIQLFLKISSNLFSISRHVEETDILVSFGSN